MTLCASHLVRINVAETTNTSLQKDKYILFDKLNYNYTVTESFHTIYLLIRIMT